LINNAITITSPITIWGTGTFKASTALVPEDWMTITAAPGVTISGITFSMELPANTIKRALRVMQCQRLLLENCKFLFPVMPQLDGRYQTIRMDRTSYFKVRGCHFEVTDPTFDGTIVETSGSLVRHGLYMAYGCRHGIISDNTSNWVGVPIIAQYINGGQLVSDLVITSNALRNSGHYGIACYSRTDDFDFPISNCTISNNVIDTVYGNFYNTATFNYTHGAGIYLQTTTNTTVTGNVVRNVNINTNSQTLVPAAIGGLLRNINTTITGNTCDGGTYFGIVAAGEYNTVSGNTLTNFVQSSIFINIGKYITIQGNVINNTDTALVSTNGIRIFNSIDEIVSHISITGNTIINCYYGIRLELTEYFQIIGNNIFQDDEDINLGQGIATIETAKYGVISGNTIKRNPTGRGLSVASESLRVHNNFVDGGAANQNILVGALSTKSIISNNITQANNNNNAIGVIQIPAAESINIRWYSPGVLVELTAPAVAIVGALNMASFVIRNDLYFSIMSTVEGNTIAHASAPALLAARFRLTAGVNLTMAINVIYSFRWSPTLSSWVQMA